jgi:hypothetical protein
MITRVSGFMCLILCVSSSAATAQATISSVRVLATEAVVRVRADPTSVEITRVPAGTVLEIQQREDAWYAVWLAADSRGNRRIGYIAASDVGLLSARPAEPSTAAGVQASPQDARPSNRGEFEAFGGATGGLQGSRAFVILGDTVADTGERTTLPTLGLGVTGWFAGTNDVLGFYADFSFVDGGTAETSIGGLSSSAQSWLVDFHSGLTVQYPSERVRPYANLGFGWGHQSLKVTFAGFGATEEQHVSGGLASVTVGGGVRILFPPSRVGIRIGLEGVAVSAEDAEAGSYSRFVVGVFSSWGRGRRP